MAQIIIPPWLQNTPDPANYARGLEIGQRSAAQQFDQLQRLKENEARREDAARRINAEVQMQRERLTQQRQLEEQALELKRQEASIPAEQAAAQFRGQKLYEDTLSRLVSSGMSEEDARREAFSTAAPLMLSRTPAAMPAMIRALAKPGQPQVMDFKGTPVLVDPRGIPYFFPKASEQAGAESVVRAVKLPDGSTVNVLEKSKGPSQLLPNPQESIEKEERQALRKTIADTKKELAPLKASLSGLGAEAEKKNPRTYAFYKQQVDALQAQIDANTKRLNQLLKKGPAVGTVKDGYRFLGGNAGSRDSWERVDEEEEQ